MTEHKLVQRIKIIYLKIIRYLKRVFSESYMPTWESFFFVFIMVLIFFVLSHYAHHLACSFNFLCISQESNHYQNLIAIHSGIGVIIFALIIFIAESLRDNRTKDMARVLLKESFLYPLVTAEILVFFIFIFGSVNVFSILSIFIIGLLTIYSLTRTISVLLFRHKFLQKRTQLFKNLLRKNIYLEIKEREDTLNLFSELKKTCLTFSPINKEGYYCFSSEKLGIVSRIDTSSLIKISDVIKKEGKRKELPFKKEAQPDIDNDSDHRNVVFREEKCYLMKKINDIVSEDDKSLICVDKNLVKEQTICNKIKSLVTKTFTITPENEFKTFTKEVYDEISSVRDQFTHAIYNKNLREIQELRSLYIELAESFLETIEKSCGNYSSQDSRSERLSFYGPWDELQWLSSDVRILIETAAESHNQKIIDKVMYLPIAILRNSIKKNDHLLFQEFISLTPLIYESVKKEDDENLRKSCVNKLADSLRKSCEIYIEFKWRNDTHKEPDFKSLKDFVVFFFFIFQSLLKKSFDNNDFESFRKFKETSLDIFDSLSFQEEGIELTLKKSSLNKEERSKLEGQRDKIRMENEIFLRQKEMFFGLSSWIMSEILKRRPNTIMLECYNSLQSIFPPRNIKDFTLIFLAAIKSYDFTDFWQWGRWEFDPTKREQIKLSETPTNLKKFYISTMLQLLSDSNQNNAQLDLSKKDLSLLVDIHHSLKEILDDIQKNPANWDSILTTEDISNNAKKFEKLLDGIFQRYMENKVR